MSDTGHVPSYLVSEDNPRINGESPDSTFVRPRSEVARAAAQVVGDR
jgi:hypothetical protein